MNTNNNPKDIETSINNMYSLYEKIKHIIHKDNNEYNSFSLTLFSLEFDDIETNYSTYLEISKEILSFIIENKPKKVRLFNFEKDKIIIFAPGSVVEGQKFFKKVLNKYTNLSDIFVDKNIVLKINKSEVEWPRDGDNFDQLLSKLVDKLNENNCNDLASKFNIHPDNIIINKSGKYLNNVKKKSTQLYLIAKNNNLEIIKQNIIAEKSFQIRGGGPGNFELFYILDGKISYAEGEKILNAGDSITARCGKEEKYFKTLTEVTLLYITSNPIFASEQKRINELLALNNKIAETDHETNQHCNRLQKLSRLTAEEMGLEEKRIFNLGFASFLHDIGKVKVPATLLQKPAKLTKEEWKIMKKHTEWGKEIILDNFNSEYFDKIAEIIYQHHERYNGKGYPQGLKGNQILIEARILSVVDAYDAMIYERPYQKALTREAALAEIKSEKGKQFCPDVVDAFFKAEKIYQQRNHDI